MCTSISLPYIFYETWIFSFKRKFCLLLYIICLYKMTEDSCKELTCPPCMNTNTASYIHQTQHLLKTVPIKVTYFMRIVNMFWLYRVKVPSIMCTQETFPTSHTDTHTHTQTHTQTQTHKHTHTHTHTHRHTYIHTHTHTHTNSHHGPSFSISISMTLIGSVSDSWTIGHVF